MEGSYLLVIRYPRPSGAILSSSARDWPSQPSARLSHSHSRRAHAPETHFFVVGRSGAVRSPELGPRPCGRREAYPRGGPTRQGQAVRGAARGGEAAMGASLENGADLPGKSSREKSFRWNEGVGRGRESSGDPNVTRG